MKTCYNYVSAYHYDSKLFTILTVEEESSENGSASHDRPSVGGSTRSSFSGSDHISNANEEVGKKPKKKQKKEKDKVGLFKGLGHMFRYSI